MTTERSLILAAIENPADSAPWYAYADWLRDHDRPDAALFVHRVTASIAILATQDRVWRYFVTQLHRFPLEYDRLSTGLLGALEGMARLAAERPVARRCECGRVLEARFPAVCGECAENALECLCTAGPCPIHAPV